MEDQIEAVEGAVVEEEPGREVALQDRAEGALQIGGLSRSQALELGQVLAASGYFRDAQSAAQGAVKILAGQELGIPPVAALRGIDFIDGSISLSGELCAAIIRRSAQRIDVATYDYRIAESTNERCEIVFIRDGKDLSPSSVFDLDDAKRAELVGAGKARANWTRYPKMMLFWRAMTQGIRLHAPELAQGGGVYVPEELDADLTVDQHGEIKREAPPPPVTSEEGKALIEKCRATFAELAEENSEIMAPTVFNRGLVQHQHDEGSLRDLLGSLEHLRDTERKIKALEAEAREVADVNEVDKAVASSRGRKQAERKDALERLIEAAGA